MADIKTKAARSANMAAIKGKNTKPEVMVRKVLFSHGYRYRKNAKNIVWHPDIWMPKYNTAIFVNGCFWHRHSGCKYSYLPKSNTEFWNRKFEQNIARDNREKSELEEKGIKCLVVWECTVKKMLKKHNPEKEESFLNAVCSFLNSDALYEEL